MAKGFQEFAVQSCCVDDSAAGDGSSADSGSKPSLSSIASSVSGTGADEADLLITEMPAEPGTHGLSLPCTPAPPTSTPAEGSIYPVFHETNPFRLSDPAGRDQFSSRGVDGGGSLRTVVRRRTSVSSAAQNDDPFSSVADSDCESFPRSQSSLPGSGSQRNIQRRESFWDRLPTTDSSSMSGEAAAPDEVGGAAGSDSESSSHQLISRLGFGAGAPTVDQTRTEGRELFLGFVRDRIEQDLPENEMPLVVQQNDEYVGRILAMPGLNNPVWAQTGAELRCMADAFASSHQRQELRSKAELTNLTDITWERFRKLLEELFAGEAGVTQERILVLFFFLADCVIATLRRHAWRHLRRLIEWSLRYIVERVCALVQEAGGWTVVFRSSIEYVIMFSKISAFVLLGLAAFIYIRKNL